ncbi:MAG: Sodium/glucose cotransporter [Flavobacteriaceae bacterium]|nr:MAG: Sodium/glucose cotransporter [Flavobacteriaceae bacterium]
MELVDWIILLSTLIFIVAYGIWKTRGTQNIKDYVLGGKEANWATIGLSVMATQASAITFLSTPGQAYHDGMGFVQFYFGLPIAMVVIILVFIPLYYRLNVQTAYEFLENRFNAKTRTLTAVLFLIQRGLSAGITIYAPAIILSAVLGWPLKLLVVAIGGLVILYTVSGGTKAVNVTHKQQMFVIMGGMFVALYMIISGLPSELSFSDALTIADQSGKLEVFDFSLDPNNRYTFWSGITGGFFLALSYFGTDQSQVQRYLSGKSKRESQLGLAFNGIFKIPMQFFILFVGVMVFVFYQFNDTPIHFNPTAREALQAPEYRSEYDALNKELSSIQEEKQQLQLNYLEVNDRGGTTEIALLQSEIQKLDTRENELRNRAKELITEADPSIASNDKDYVFIHYILNNLPVGLIGLLLAVILSAAMSSTASELNALGTITTLDIYKRYSPASKVPRHYLKVSKVFTLVWGIIAIIIASVASLFENLIQLVNIIGSIFYGNVLGIFLLAFFFKRIHGKAVFYAAIITQILVIMVFYADFMSYLWLNLLGCALVIVIAQILQLFRGEK